MFTSAADIGNRALQHCGVPRMDPTLGFADGTQRANETGFAYGKLKRAELERNTWTFATRRAVLRPIDTTTMVLAPTLWASGTTYFQGSIVADNTGFLWQSRIASNLGNQPTASPVQWEPYFGPMSVMLYDSTQVYFAGELVYTAPGDGSYNTYLSLLSGNGYDPSLPNGWSASATYFQNKIVRAFAAWNSGTTYAAGATVTYTDGNTYSSLIGGNLNNIPTGGIGTKWALVPLLIINPTVPAPYYGTSGATQNSPVIEWNAATVYSIGNFVQFDGNQYVSLLNNNTGNLPDAAASTSWALISGGTLYMSLINLNINNNPANAPALWSATTTYTTGNQVGGSDGQIYTSVGSGNLGNNPVTDGGVHWTATGILNPWTTVFVEGGGNQQWLQIGGAAFPAGVGLTTANIVYPLGSGPSSQSSTRNIFRLPAGWLREAPQDPKAGSVSYLGAPSGMMYNDWDYEDDYLISSFVDPIVYRFVANVSDVTKFHSMFCEGLAVRIALEVVEILTQSTAKLQTLSAMYTKFMGEARTRDGIESGPVEPPEDDFVACRL